MKKTFLLLLLVMLYISALARQSPIVVIEKKSLSEGDSLRIFGIAGMNIDVCISKLISYLGTPAMNATGDILWERIPIAGLDSSVSISFIDGIRTRYEEGRIQSESTFNNEADKKERMARLAPNEKRFTEITVTNPKGWNIIVNQAQEDVVKAFMNKAFEND